MLGNVIHHNNITLNKVEDLSLRVVASEIIKQYYFHFYEPSQRKIIRECMVFIQTWPEFVVYPEGAAVRRSFIL